MRTLPPSQLGHELREEAGPDLRRRRWVVGLSILGTVAAQIVALYQTGLVEHLSDPPVGPFDGCPSPPRAAGHLLGGRRPATA